MDLKNNNGSPLFEKRYKLPRKAHNCLLYSHTCPNYFHRICKNKKGQQIKQIKSIRIAFGTPARFGNVALYDSKMQPLHSFSLFWQDKFPSWWNKVVWNEFSLRKLWTQKTLSVLVVNRPGLRLQKSGINWSKTINVYVSSTVVQLTRLNLHYFKHLGTDKSKKNITFTEWDASFWWQSPWPGLVNWEQKLKHCSSRKCIFYWPSDLRFRRTKIGEAEEWR